jgi:hypothetical protein
MDKIPVGRTIGFAYGFAFKKFFTILGLIWLPFALTVAAVVAMGMQSNLFRTAIATNNPAALAKIWFIVIPFYLLAFVLLFMQIVAITQQALGLRSTPTYFYFSLGMPVWRLVGAFLLVGLLIIAAFLVFIVGAALVGTIIGAVTGLAPGTKPSASAAIALGLTAITVIVILYCAFIYAVMRQTFLLTPVVVAEEKIGLRRAWSLGRGNFWRMLAIILSIMLPILLAEIVFVFGFVFHGLPPMAAQGASPEQIAIWNAQNAARLQHYWYLWVPVYLVFSTILYGLFCGAQAFAYRTLVPTEKAEGIF